MTRRSAPTPPVAALTPTSTRNAMRIELWLKGEGVPVPQRRVCEWRIDGRLVAETSCAERVSGPGIELALSRRRARSPSMWSANRPSSPKPRVKDLLIAGMGDSFASGEGNPNLPVAFGDSQPLPELLSRAQAERCAAAVPRWTDELCHRSLYGQQLRAALQIAIENPQASVTFLDYSCSGASITDGILGPQTYVERIASSATGPHSPPPAPSPAVRKDSQLYRLLRELCPRTPSR